MAGKTPRKIARLTLALRVALVSKLLDHLPGPAIREWLAGEGVPPDELPSDRMFRTYKSTAEYGDFRDRIIRVYMAKLHPKSSPPSPLEDDDAVSADLDSTGAGEGVLDDDLDDYDLNVSRLSDSGTLEQMEKLARWLPQDLHPLDGQAMRSRMLKMLDHRMVRGAAVFAALQRASELADRFTLEARDAMRRAAAQSGTPVVDFPTDDLRLPAVRMDGDAGAPPNDHANTNPDASIPTGDARDVFDAVNRAAWWIARRDRLARDPTLMTPAIFASATGLLLKELDLQSVVRMMQDQQALRPGGRIDLGAPDLSARSPWTRSLDAPAVAELLLPNPATARRARLAVATQYADWDQGESPAAFATGQLTPTPLPPLHRAHRRALNRRDS